MRLGIDTWSGYGQIDWPKAEASGISFAWIRATGAVGTGGVDSQAALSARNVRQTSIAAGPYHVFHHAQDPAKSAEACFRAVDGLGSALGDLPPVLDAEIPGIATIKPIASQVVTALERHVEAFESRFLNTPVVYGYKFWFDALGDALAKSSTIGRCVLWIAAYPRLEPWTPDLAKARLPPVPRPWREALVWQYSAEHSVPVPGVGSPMCRTPHASPCQLVDRNVFLGDDAAWRALRGLDAPAVEETSGGIVRPAVPLGRPALDS